MAPRLRYDENLAARLVGLLRSECPESAHVRDPIRPGATDEQTWEYARIAGLVIVTKDEDFQRCSMWRGFPPKVIWIQLGNCPTDDIATLLRNAQSLIADYVVHPDAGFLPLRARDA